MDTRLINLLEEYSSRNREIDENLRLYHDLNIYGDDASELMDRFKNEFNVDVSKFRFDDYFPSEGDWILPSILHFFISRKPKEYKPITLSDLHQAVEKGYLE